MTPYHEDPWLTDRVTGLREAAQVVVNEWTLTIAEGGLVTIALQEPIDMLRAALLAEPVPGLDVERLARAMEAVGCEPSCGSCGADITYHGECPEGDGTLVWTAPAGEIAAEYVLSGETPDADELAGQDWPAGREDGIG